MEITVTLRAWLLSILARGMLISMATFAVAGDREFTAVTAWGNTAIFQRGNDGALQYRTYTPSEKLWSRWEGVAGVAITSSPSALMTSETRLAVFFRGIDSKLYHVFQDKGANWSAVIGLGSRELSSGPTTLIIDGQLTVFARNIAGMQMQIYYDQTKQSWTDWSEVD